MYLKAITWKILFILFIVPFLSAQAFADCPNACDAEYSNCQKAATSQAQKNHCWEQSSVCTLNCNRDKTMYCTYLGFRDYEGIADKEKELKKITGGFTRVTSDGSPHFDGLCNSYNLKCSYVLDWNKKMYSCGGEIRESKRVACCR